MHNQTYLLQPAVKISYHLTLSYAHILFVFILYIISHLRVVLFYGFNSLKPNKMFILDIRFCVYNDMCIMETGGHNI